MNLFLKERGDYIKYQRCNQDYIETFNWTLESEMSRESFSRLRNKAYEFSKSSPNKKVTLKQRIQ